MSTDIARASRFPFPPRTFRGTVALVLGVLLVAATLLAAVPLIQGPRLVRADVDETLLASTTGQRILLHFSQPLSSQAVDGVTLTGADGQVADISATIDGADMLVRVTGRLDAATDYTVSVPAALGLYTAGGAASTTFRTPDPQLVALDRGDHHDDGTKDPDRIVSVGYRETATTTLYEAPYIESFALLGDLIAVVTIEADGTNALWITDGTSGQVERVELPGTGTITALDAGTPTLLGFGYTELGGEPEVYVFNLTTHSASPILGLDGDPVPSSEWGFVGDTSRLLLHDNRDGTLSQFDALDPTAIVPLGTVGSLMSIGGDGAFAVVSSMDVDGVNTTDLLDLATRDTGLIVAPEAETGQQLFGAPAQPEADRLLQWFVEYSFDGYGASLKVSDVVADAGAGGDANGAWTDVYEVPAGNVVSGMTVAVGGRFAALETYPDGTASDEYPVNAKPIDGITTVIDTRTGAVVQTLQGTDVAWRFPRG